MCAGRNESGNGLYGVTKDVDHTAEFLKRCAEWRHEDDYIADRAQQEPLPARLHRYLVADPLFERIGFFALFILYQLDGRDESLLPDLSHMVKLPERLKEPRHRPNLGLQSSERLLLLEHLDVGQRHGAAERIPRIAMAVEEGFE